MPVGKWLIHMTFFNMVIVAIAGNTVQQAAHAKLFVSQTLVHNDSSSLLSGFALPISNGKPAIHLIISTLRCPFNRRNLEKGCNILPAPSSFLAQTTPTATDSQLGRCFAKTSRTNLGANKRTDIAKSSQKWKKSFVAWLSERWRITKMMEIIPWKMSGYGKGSS